MYYQLAHERSSGPAWGRELLDCLRKDKRFAERLGPVRDWAEVPTADASDLKETNPFREAGEGGTMAFFSSGTMGLPTRVKYSQQDWDAAVDHRAACLSQVGVKAGDTVAVLLSHGPWFSGDNIADALLSLKTQVLSGGIYLPHLPANVELIRRLAVDTIVTTPSVAMILAESAPVPTLRRLILVGENLNGRLRDFLSQRFKVKPQCLFAASEAILGYEDPDEAGIFVWDPDKVYLEVLDDTGKIKPHGTGELVVSRRYGTASPLLRYRLGDRAELSAEKTDLPRFRFLGRVGHGFSLATGVKVSRTQIEGFFDSLPFPVLAADFSVAHTTKGGDKVDIRLQTPHSQFDPKIVVDAFSSLTMDIADVAACGYLECEATRIPAVSEFICKRRVTFSETPWAL